jgi:2'-5' RNA ligase
MPRLFTGLEVPPDVAGSLAMMRGGLLGARWIEPQDYHVTLRFLGDIDDDVAHELAMLLSTVRRPAVTLTVGALDVFGGDKPRALVARIEQTSALAEMQAEQERLVRRVGLPPDKRKFSPHVTLARLRDTSPWHAADFLSQRGHFLRRSFKADRFVIFSSRASVGGGPYVVEAAYPLAS